MNAYYAVIFSSALSDDSEGYAAAAARMEELVQDQEGFLGMESVRDAGGRGITVSYWKDEASILKWKSNYEHREIQKLGKEKWYTRYSLRISRVTREYHKE